MSNAIIVTIASLVSLGFGIIVRKIFERLTDTKNKRQVYYCKQKMLTQYNKMETFKELTFTEKTVNIIAYIILAAGMIGSLIMAFTITTDYRIYSGSELNPVGLGITIGTLFMSVLLWALLRLAVEVSVNIRNIANK